MTVPWRGPASLALVAAAAGVMAGVTAEAEAPFSLALAAAVAAVSLGLTCTIAPTVALMVCGLSTLALIGGGAVSLLSIPLLAGSAARRLLLRQPMGRPASLALALAGSALSLTLGGYVLNGAGDLQFVGSIVTLTVGVLAAWIVYRQEHPIGTLNWVLGIGWSVAIGYLSYAIPRASQGGLRNPWVSVYANDVWANPNTMGAFLAITFAVGVAFTVRSHRGPLVATCVLIPLSLAILLTFSRSTYLACLACLGVALLRRSRWKAALLTGLVATLLLIDDTAISSRVSYTLTDGQLDPSSGMRLELWRAAIPQTLSNPWGSGPVANTVLLPSGASFPYAHNLFLSVPLRFGIVSGALLLIGTLALLARLWRSRGLSGASEGALLAVVAAIIVSLFGEPLLQLTTAIPLTAIVAAGFRSIDIGRSGATSDSSSGGHESRRTLVP